MTDKPGDKITYYFPTNVTVSATRIGYGNIYIIEIDDPDREVVVVRDSRGDRIDVTKLTLRISPSCVPKVCSMARALWRNFVAWQWIGKEKENDR